MRMTRIQNESVLENRAQLKGFLEFGDMGAGMKIPAFRLMILRDYCKLAT